MTDLDASRIVGLADGSVRALEITPVNLAFALDHLIDLLVRYDTRGVCLRGFQRDSLDFLVDFGEIEVLQIKASKQLSLPDLGRLPRLRELLLDDVARKHVVDLSRLRNLESLRVAWGKGVVGLKDAFSLREVGISHAKVESIGDLLLPSSVLSLQLMGAGLKNLVGIDRLGHLNRLRLVNLGKDFSIKEICESSSLRVLDIEGVRLADEVVEIGNFNQLRELFLLNCGAVSSISWIAKLEMLESLSIFRTPIKDGDMTPLLKLKNLTWVDYLVPNSSHAAEEIRALLGLARQPIR